MRAVVYDPEARANLRLADVDEPAASDSEALTTGGSVWDAA